MSVTRDVSIHVIHPQNEGGRGSFTLLEVQGTKVGEEALVETLACSQPLTPSDVNVFVRDLTITTCTFCFACVILFSQMFMKKALPHSELL